MGAKLLRHGVKLYELKPQHDGEERPHDRGLTGNSGSSLHAKTFSVDNEKVFIGSFNFDPRSAVLNTEMGLLIESDVLAGNIHQRFVEEMRDRARSLRLDKWGRINWVEYEGEPGKWCINMNRRRASGSVCWCGWSGVCRWSGCCRRAFTPAVSWRESRRGRLNRLALRDAAFAGKQKAQQRNAQVNLIQQKGDAEDKRRRRRSPARCCECAA